MAREVVDFCNRDLISDSNFDYKSEYHSEWFDAQFAFVDRDSLRKQLGMAFYQARYIYKLMVALRLTRAKFYGILKFQIIQYASICEAVIKYVVDSKFKKELKPRLLVVPPDQCKKCKKRKKRYRNGTMADFTDVAVAQGVISAEVGDRIRGLYKVRNNVHLLTAADIGYKPTLREAIEAYTLVKDMLSDVRSFYAKTTTGVSISL